MSLHFKSIGVVVPDYSKEFTEGLVEFRHGVQIMLRDMLSEHGATVQPVSRSLSDLRITQDLPTDLIQFFSVELDGHLLRNIEKVGLVDKIGW